MLDECLDKACLKKADIDYVIMLNGNDRHNEHYLREIACLHLENSKPFIGDVGHIGGADFIYNLERCLNGRHVAPGGHILAYSGGAGYSWATGIFKVEQ